MLQEREVAEVDPAEGRRRWFTDDYLDLTVWQGPAGGVDGFHLVYGAASARKGLSWTRRKGVAHFYLDPRPDGTARRRPVLGRAAKFPDPALLAEFRSRAAKVRKDVRLSVETVLSGDAPAASEPARGPGGKGGRGGGPAVPEEILKKVRRIEITTRRIVDEIMTGDYRTRFKGHGVQFSEHRLYVPGDDVRHIDWKVSARTRDPLVKKFEEERELTVLLIVDVSGSGTFGSSGKLKSEVAAEIGAMLAYAATHSGDKVGALLFAGEVEKVVPPRKGRLHVLRLIRDILGYRPVTHGSNLADALESAGRIMKHAGIVFIISDFIVPEFDVQLKRLARRNDIVAVWVGDEREKKIAGQGLYLFTDPETGQELVVDTSSYSFRNWLEGFKSTHETDTITAFKGGRVELLPVTTSEDYGEAVVRFFRARGRKRR